MLFLIVSLALGAERLAQNRFSFSGAGHLMISVDQSSFPSIDRKLTAFLQERLRGLTLETMSTVDDRVSLHYRYRRQKGFDWTAFVGELNQVAGTANVEVFIG